jgi:glutamate---cysteine ligase / carboxylate-amine ligase
MTMPAEIPDAATLRRRFDETGGGTVGVEEEVMLLDPESFDLAPLSTRVLDRLKGDPRFKPELPTAHLEIVTTPETSAPAAVAQLAAARRDLAAASEGLAVLAAAGVHPFASREGRLNRSARYDEIRREFGPVAQRQLVASLQVHVAVGGAARTLAVYNALRCYLPELAALAANAPFYAGADSGLASVRPGICVQLPRQGVPPRLESWEQFAQHLRWGAVAGSLPDPSRWWWELRPHIIHGTLELRVPDAQTTVNEAAGMIAFAQALVVYLAERYDADEPLPDAHTWQIEENRWSAARYGVQGTLADLATGRRRPTRERLRALTEQIRPVAQRLGSAELLTHTHRSIERNGAIRQREACVDTGPRDLGPWLARQFLS